MKSHLGVEIIKYDATWPDIFAGTKRVIAHTLAKHARQIEHIGSTAVPGLAAKPIIDILVEVRDIAGPSIRTRLESAGYSLIVDEPGHRMFRTADRDVHLHLWKTDDSEIDRHLLFRDWLRANEADRRLYEAEKRRLASQDWPTQNDYAQAKTPIIDEILGRARESRER